MGEYIEDRESSYYWFGDEDERILEVIAARYIGANPPIPFALRTFSKTGILQTAEGLYDMDFPAKLPHAEDGDYVYAYGLVWSDGERAIDGVLEPLGPVRLFVNEKLEYHSTVVDELDPKARIKVPLVFTSGWNTLLIEARKTPSGFGCRFGADEAKVRILQVLAPFADRQGSAGWVYSEPVKTACFGGSDQGQAYPDWQGSEAATGLEWFPAVKWPEQSQGLPNLERICGNPAQPAAAYAWSSVRIPVSADRIELSGTVRGTTHIWVDDSLATTVTGGGPFHVQTEVQPGVRQIVVRTENAKEGWGFELAAEAGGKPLAFTEPVKVHGNPGTWLYLGPLPAERMLKPQEIRTLKKPFDGLGGCIYWAVDAPETRVRPFYENAMLSNKWTTEGATNFGRWDYPLGVTMYGLLRTAKELNRPDIRQYALSHISSCTEMYEYSLWDREEYGFPGINHQLVLLRMLDNCGSFGSAMLEAYLDGAEQAEFRKIADTIADFMLHRLERREDGAFYRRCEGEYSADTMWADDLYMSAPFLTRYSMVTGEADAINEAAKQFLRFKRYLYMSDQQVMSHVYDFKYGQPTLIPWGRGNGWVLFSLSELLERLPETHEDREELLTMFRELSQGIAALQSDSGLWHQVLNRPDAYLEASCTAMFVYAFSRGVRFGWLDREGPYIEAALKGWRGLAAQVIDRQGNVHGVCSGSRYSFSPDYYMEDLRTVRNDNHGIGIMMLAAVEVLRLKALRSSKEGR
ncbi:glycoside hydrolase family 88 protein [Paenibacillus phoenicis]|uniref:Glycoside hydrolase family 88 protein n=1 Tax=Paenibacillus phoenicis TaxID=554117 RepID=A0ABU5PKN3_9BACL|nr:glycoside hydrolase family 88 protein [Paenibacillus phoenicis]MEA3570441.1 glycoside hydrolase family 88 protein [Paenibacillus phoenicis]